MNDNSTKTRIEFKMCTKCILDNNDDKFITFDDQGVCNYCYQYEALMSNIPPLEKRLEELNHILRQIKKDGKGKKFDVILGLSGGVDSSFLAYLCKKYELRTLVVHLDNGWNSDTAVKNIYNLVNQFGFELVTHVIDWEEFKDLQLAYLKASVIDIEAITDHAIMALLYKMAAKYKIKYILSGANYTGEALMIKNWVWKKSDWLNIKSIHQKFGQKKLKTFPHISFWEKLLYHNFYKIKIIPLLNYIDYNPIEAKKILTDQVGWVDYGTKHGESVFTRFYQNYILVRKFNVDKRKLHLSNLIWSGKLSRDEALQIIQKKLYTDQELAFEKEYVLKKLGLSNDEFEHIMNLPVRSHQEFDSDERLYKIYFKLIKIMKKLILKN
jgi:N-acetyl sugar amidotransferase